MSRPQRCRHVCACGAVLVCGEPDKCAAGAHWQCPICEQECVDAYWQTQSMNDTNHEHEQEQMRHERF